nr:uncharacterized protein LOC129382723 isoform X1 [Dermacentor andersoni]XP_054922834.1 uncharacterized protein LOC129382723 isoform X1 [Dermacentor andersoni]XP_054922835.1 uncharacterized protein LOC129382723 isoform X1 [Dermacentor andersoni]XP_054922836.1 uncharacterized protein LOC129382723 isoform X1 [Dermacentor andersoni]XP_054922837.1 uncharacterized protein LOC129382723 isoform X1 [Dermacentor andersoni]XP_054922838.1 uncharacterized protein LOC129382723 isoform X1 [Dermacentor ande
MFQTLYDDLPPMSTEVLALRKKFWDAEGYHLILNSPKNLADVWKKGPLRPFAGLCVAFLVLIREDHQMFCPQIGTRPKCYQVGYAPQKKNHAFGLISIANTGGTSWVGYKDPDHDGFPAGYYYSCFYFINQNTLHGFINNIHLPSDNANPYEVNKASEDILFGQGGYHEAENLEIHWVVWSSVDNKSSNPSLLDKLFAPDDHGEYDYEAATLFHGTNGCVITIVTKFQQNTHAGKRASASYKCIHFGLGKPGHQYYKRANFPECNDTSAVYTFRLNIMETNVVIFWKSIMREVETSPFSKGTSTEGVYFMMNNVKPIRVYVETMGDILDWPQNP